MRHPAMQEKSFGSTPTLGFLIEPAGLGAVSTVLHITPAASFVAAGIQKKPPAGRVGARFDILQLSRYQQLGCGPDYRIEDPVQPGFVANCIPVVTIFYSYDL